MSNSLLVRAMVAGAAIAPFRIVRFDAIDGQVLQAAAATDLSVGVVEHVAAASGERCDVVLVGVAEITLGAAVTRGSQLTSDATGRAVTAIAGNRRIGIALVSGVVGDVVEVLLNPGTA